MCLNVGLIYKHISIVLNEILLGILPSSSCIRSGVGQMQIKITPEQTLFAFILAIK